MTAVLQHLCTVIVISVLHFIEAKSLKIKKMKKRRSKVLNLKKGIISDLEKINGGLKPSRTGDTALCVTRAPYCPEDPVGAS